MPDAGVAHNLVIVKIRKSFPGQGKKVINSLFGAGQMMFTKYLAVVSGDLNIRNYPELLSRIFENTDFRYDLLFSSGPLDVLDHSSDICSVGGKLGIDGTIKLDEELSVDRKSGSGAKQRVGKIDAAFRIEIAERSGNVNILADLPVIIIGVDQSKDRDAVANSRKWFGERSSGNPPALIIAVDSQVDPGNAFVVTWQLLGNSDPGRDIDLLPGGSLFIDGTPKAFRKGGFPRKWPNVVCSSLETIKIIDGKWESLGIGPFIPSPSLQNSLLSYNGTDEVVVPES
jgi:4-hydroxy-3-polyprenylbenzoate decarboxylase